MDEMDALAGHSMQARPVGGNNESSQLAQGTSGCTSKPRGEDDV